MELPTLSEMEDVMEAMVARTPFLVSPELQSLKFASYDLLIQILFAMRVWESESKCLKEQYKPLALNATHPSVSLLFTVIRPITRYFSLIFINMRLASINFFIIIFQLIVGTTRFTLICQSDFPFMLTETNKIKCTLLNPKKQSCWVRLWNKIHLSLS